MLALAALLLAAAIAPQGASASRLSITSFSVDRTLNPGRTTKASPHCGRTFGFLSARFTVNATGTGASNPQNRPLVVVRSMVPQRNGATFTFQNVGEGAALIRATADCARITGGPSLRTRVVTERPGRGRNARRPTAAKGATLSALCGRENSIPGDFGFENSKDSEFAGASFIEKQGDIGVKAKFRGDEPKALHLSCVEGDGIRLDGDLSKKPLASTASAGTPRIPAAAKPRISVRYGPVDTNRAPDTPFAGVSAFVSEKPLPSWTSPFPNTLPAEAQWAGRALLDPDERALLSTPPPGKPSADFEEFFMALFAGPIVTKGGREKPGAATPVEIRGIQAIQDDRTADAVPTGGSTTLGAPDLGKVDPRFLECTKSVNSEVQPGPCSAVSDGTAENADSFAVPSAGVITELTVFQPQPSQVGGREAPVGQTIALQTFENLGGGRYRGGPVRAVGHIDGAGTFELPVNPPFEVLGGELVGIRLQPDAVGPFYLNASGNVTESTLVFGGEGDIGPLEVDEEREPDGAVGGILPVQLAFESSN